MIHLKKSIPLFFCLFLVISSRGQNCLHPANLLCEYLENPICIDVKTPRFSWTLESQRKNEFQSAYELIVSNNLEQVHEGKGNFWSTGKTPSSKSIQVKYAGKSLQPFTKYYWRVKVYDLKNQECWSEINWFETAALDPQDWVSSWISDGSFNPARDEDYYKDDRMPLFKKNFRIGKKVSSAKLYVSGLGYYEGFLNGKKIGQSVLDPGFTTYGKEVLYSVYDVSTQLKKGDNSAGFMLGNGWYNPLPFKLFGRWNLREFQQTGRPCVKAEFHIEYADGTKEIIKTDESWLTAPGPITRNNVYLGEHYDARLEQRDFLTQNTNEEVWKPVMTVPGPSGMLRSQMQPAIEITQVVSPVRIFEPRKDTFIVDMGQNFAGVARIKVKGPVGNTIVLRYGEDIFGDSTLNYLTTCATQIKKGGIKGGPGTPETAWQEDRYTLKGNGLEEWSPRFTFHGFRYVEITGWPGKPTLKDIEGLRMNANVAKNGEFACSNKMLNKLHEAIKWTFLSNIFSIQSDCPGREKMGYGGDMVATADAFMFNFGMANFYAKSVQDFANEQRPSGGITEIAPFTGIADKGYGDDSGPLGWQLAFPYLQDQLYEFYGDEQIITDHYEAFKKQLDFLASRSMDGIFYWDISDHEALDAKPEALTAAAFYYHHLCLGVKFATILHAHEDSTLYANRAKDVLNSIVRKFLVQGTGKFDNATQSAQLFALWYGLSPEKEMTMAALMEEFKRHNWHLSTGIFSTRMLFEVLRMNDLNDIAYKIATQPDYPGWGYMINSGATTLWETWQYPESGPSQNHPMFGSVDEWFYRSILGINPLAAGFEKVQIKPQPAGDLSWARGRYKSIRGPIVCDWSIGQGKFHLKVGIPANTKAEIWIPAKNKQSVMGADKLTLDHDPDIRIIGMKGSYLVVEAGSGSYEFVSEDFSK
ncbi:MAG: alpha-L-rhamnosidase [Bacteroidetes bacterium]|nr:MAG: alpha-L-rhamnosidase [Bacteroidota bacterium]